MATVTWDELHYLILPELPGCPTATVNNALAATASEFCARTHVWREALDFQYSIPNLADYDVDGTAVIETVNTVTVEDTELTRVDVRSIDPTKLEDTGEPRSYWVVNDISIRLFPIPEEKKRLNIQVTLKPSRDAEGIEDWIYESYVDTIVAGAIARLTRIAGKEWTNPDSTAYYTREYEKGIVSARIRDKRNVELRVNPVKFGG